MYISASDDTAWSSPDSILVLQGCSVEQEKTIVMAGESENWKGQVIIEVEEGRAKSKNKVVY
jgi:3-deoxy-D-arabino-heptulosonate 7-phosphate (DAHP) synthase